MTVSRSIKMQKRKNKRALRVRKFLKGSAEKPRLSVNKSNAHLYVQLIDDSIGKTLCSSSTLSIKEKGQMSPNIESAKIIGEEIAKKCKNLGIKKVIFDRGPFKYHGVLAALAETARSAGLEF